VSSVNNTIRSLRGNAALVAENRTLRDELATMQRENYTARALAAENDRLRSLTGSTVPRDSRVTAAVINGGGFSPYDSFVVDQGTTAGVNDGMLVLTPEGIVVGAVRTALATTAIVSRFSATGMTTDVVIESTSTIHARLSGRGGGTMMLTIPRTIAVDAGDPVFLPTRASYEIGSVVRVEASPEDAYQTVYVADPVNPYELRFVLIDTSSVWQPAKDTERIVTESTAAATSTTP
jgi:rod shape-determining protein MreC